MRAWVHVQEVEGVGDSGGGRVMTGEDEGLDLVDGCRAEGGIHCLLEFFFVRAKGEGDDGAVA